MTANRLRSAFGFATAVALALLSALAAWTAVRATAIARGGPTLAKIAPNHPDAVLERETIALVRNKGIINSAALAAVGSAALRAPLDARPYLVLGHESLMQRHDARALTQLEAGQRLDPRQRLIHLLLLDRYLRTNRYPAAAAQFGVLSRLVGKAQAPIAEALAQMSVAPDTREATRLTLRSDPQLESSVLMALARSNADPAIILGLASPRGMAEAVVPNAWGGVLVARMVTNGQYAAARTVWQRLYRLTDAQVAAPIFDAEMRGIPASPPFNWGFPNDGAGAADLRNGSMTVDYYGRQTGELASQLLVLRPGAYRFVFTLGGSPTAGGTTLSWSVVCAGQGGRVAMELTVPPVATTQRRVGAPFSVPAGCPAQRLVLTGNAGEFTAPITATVQALSIRPAGAKP